MTPPFERIALFIDGSNLFAAAKALGFDIDYKKLLEFFSGRGYLVRALYYTAVIEDQEYSPIRPLVDWLDYNGYTMITKPTKEFTDATGRRKIKGNMDIELAVDMLEMAPHIDHAVLFSGDGDGELAAKELEGVVLQLRAAEAAEALVEGEDVDLHAESREGLAELEADDAEPDHRDGLGQL